MIYLAAIIFIYSNQVVWSQICSHVGVEIRADRGEVSSPNFPGSYPGSSLCRWKISLADRSGVITFRFQTISLEVCGQCSCDYVRFWDGVDDRARLIGTYCTMPSQPIGLTTGPNLYVEFSSDTSGAGRGFKLLFERNETACSGSTRVITREQGDITTPFYPYFPYSSRMRCSWRIDGQVGQTVVLNIANLDTEINYDVLRIYDGPNTGGRILGALSGRHMNRVVRSSSRQLYMQFTTDSSNVRTGFLLRYAIVGTAVTSPHTPGPTLVPPPRVSNPPLLEIELEGSFRTSDSSTISSYCASAYSSALRKSGDNMMDRVNEMLAASQMCPTYPNLQMLTSSLTQTTMVSRGYPKFHFLMPSAETQSLTNASLCGNDINSYMQVHANWYQPILPTPDGCASVVWDPANFTGGNNNWICYHDTIPYLHPEQ